MIAYRRWYPWIGLTLILICFVILVIREHPTNYFGLTADDAVYFSSAKALAQGKGYILANLPGTPPATKYPILYSWILSWVWRLNGSFPANLTDATAITVVFGLAFISLSFIFLRGLRGINSAESLLITAFCAFHPRIIFFSGSIMSDIPFAAMALAAMLLADRAMRPQARGTLACSSGILAVLSILTRLTGIAVVAGILVTAIARRAWRPLFFFCGCVTPFFAVMAWRLTRVSKSQVSAVLRHIELTPGLDAHVGVLHQLYSILENERSQWFDLLVHAVEQSEPDRLWHIGLIPESLAGRRSARQSRSINRCDRGDRRWSCSAGAPSGSEMRILRASILYRRHRFVELSHHRTQSSFILCRCSALGFGSR